MAKTAISLTIEQTNLLWLKGRARVVSGGSLSEAVDQLIAEAGPAGSDRRSRRGRSSARSICPTIGHWPQGGKRCWDSSRRPWSGRFTCTKTHLVIEPRNASPGKKPSVVAEIDAAVSDTHALLYPAGGRGLGPRAAAMFQAAEARRAVIYVPMAVLWEVTLLA